MNRVEGAANVALIECTNPVKGKWRIRWDVRELGEDKVDYMEEEFDYQPELKDIKSVITDWYESQMKEEILSGFQYEGETVLLSIENLFYFKAIYDLAGQSGEILPMTFRFGYKQPHNRRFESVQEWSDFYLAAIKHIQKTLEAGWEKIDAIDWSMYQLESF